MIRNALIRSFVAFCFTAGALALTTQSAASGSSTDPAVFIKTLAEQAIRVLSANSDSLQEREDRFRTMLRDDFAMDRIGQFVVGAYWRQMSPEQRAEYQKLFSEWVLRTYSARLGGYSGEEFQVLRTSQAGKGDVIVHTRIRRASGNDLQADWRVRELDGRNKIIDVQVEGVSLLVTQRSEFESILRRDGIDGLISLLRQRLASLS